VRRGRGRRPGLAARFVPGHPIAGSERSGVGGGADLFRGTA
jgi:prephenate dehydrogenase